MGRKILNPVLPTRQHTVQAACYYCVLRRCARHRTASTPEPSRAYVDGSGMASKPTGMNMPSALRPPINSVPPLTVSKLPHVPQLSATMSCTTSTVPVRWNGTPKTEGASISSELHQGGIAGKPEVVTVAIRGSSLQMPPKNCAWNRCPVGPPVNLYQPKSHVARNSECQCMGSPL